MERKKEEVEIVGIAYLLIWGSSQFIGFDSQISVLILGIIYVFPYQVLFFYGIRSVFPYQELSF